MNDFVTLLVLIAVANAAPILGYQLLGKRYAWPIDAGRYGSDGRRVLGESKTLRGIILSLLATMACSALLRHGVLTGLVIAATAMAGDVMSSFIKRRMGKASGGRAIGLDQIPEALFPLLAVRTEFGLTRTNILIGVCLFIGAELTVSPLLYALQLRKRPH